MAKDPTIAIRDCLADFPAEPWSRSLKTGNIRSLCPYDATARHPLQSVICDSVRFCTMPARAYLSNLAT